MNISNAMSKKKRCQVQRWGLDFKRHHYMIFYLVLCFIVGAKLVTIGLYPLMDKTEARYAEIAREMIATNNWITPQLDEGKPFWGKPPLSFWLVAWGMIVFGVNEFGARISAWGLALLTAYFTFLIGAKFKGRYFGLMAVLILWTNVLFFILSGAVMTDPMLMTSVTISLGSFYLVFHIHNSLQRKVFAYLFFIGAGLSLLSKGPVGVVLIGIPLFCWTLLHNQWKVIWRKLPWIKGLLIMSIISVPWYILAERQTPGFLNYFIVGEHWERFIVPGWQGDLYGSGHAHPKGTIWLFSILAMMPWSIVFIYILGRQIKNRRKVFHSIFSNKWTSYFFLWAVSPMLLFTLASNISFHYIAPALPALSIGMALALKSYKKEAYQYTTKVPWIYSDKIIMACITFVPVTGLIAALTFLPSIGRAHSQITIIEEFKKYTKGKESELVYVGSMPHSAEYYMKGKVTRIKKGNIEGLLKEVSDGNKGFFVVKKDNSGWIPEGFFKKTKVIYQGKEYVLYKAIE